MDLEQIIGRRVPPEPWAEGDKIPWDDPVFSRRMLREHLSQAHDLASRRSEIIDRHVDWIHREHLHGQPARVLDLGCGPGLYTARLAMLGHDCTGIDFSPASIDYARSRPVSAGRATYQQADLRAADFGAGFDLVMLVFGELNMFRKTDALQILCKAHAALRPGGRILLEAHTFEFIRSMGAGESTWRTVVSGLFATEPHLILTEQFWDPNSFVATQRTFVIHAANAHVDRYVETAQAYSTTDYTSLLSSAGFAHTGTLPAMPGLPDSKEFVVLLGERVDVED